MSTKKIGVLVIHGMGSQPATFADDMITELKGRLGRNAARFVWQPVYWAAQLIERERALLHDLMRAEDPSGEAITLDWNRARNFVFQNFGDAVAYHRDSSEGGKDSVYQHVHGIVSDSLKVLKAQLPSPDSPIVIMAHSLGAHIMSNYIWDHQPDSSGKVHGTLEPIPTLAAMITFGCNIPLFSLSFAVSTPINLPGEGVKKAALVNASRWKNYLDVDDVLGWPLRPLYERNRSKLTAAQKATVDRIQDYAINVGAVLQSWNPTAHSEYWEDNDFTTPTAAYLTEIREALDA
jgi:hypothetical protein